eukprot:gene416-887_t
MTGRFELPRAEPNGLAELQNRQQQEMQNQGIENVNEITELRGENHLLRNAIASQEVVLQNQREGYTPASSMHQPPSQYGTVDTVQSDRIEELERENWLLRSRAGDATANQEKINELQVKLNQMVQRQNDIYPPPPEPYQVDDTQYQQDDTHYQQPYQSPARDDEFTQCKCTIMIRFVLFAFLSRIVSSEISSQDYLAAHNKYREVLEMRPFEWSDELATFANQWASSVAAQVNPDGVPYHYVGENIAWKWSQKGSEANAQQVIDSWMGELTTYKYGRFGSNCTVRNAEHRPKGHFTQLLWAETSEVGCVDHRCSGISKSGQAVDTILVVCNYGPGGNVEGMLPFSPTTSEKLGLSAMPCDGELTWMEERLWTSADAKFASLYQDQNNDQSGSTSLRIGIAMIISLLTHLHLDIAILPADRYSWGLRGLTAFANGCLTLGKWVIGALCIRVFFVCTSSLTAARAAWEDASSVWDSVLSSSSSIPSTPSETSEPGGQDVPMAGEFDPTSFSSEEFQAFSAYVRALHSYAKSVSDAEYLIAQYDPESTIWADALANLHHPPPELPPHFSTTVDDWKTHYESPTLFASFVQRLDRATDSISSAIDYTIAAEDDAETPEDEIEQDVLAVFTSVAQGSIYASSAADYANQRLTELGGYDWHTSCPAGVGLEVKGGLYGIDYRSKHFNSWPTNLGMFNDSATAGWKVEWNDCGWVASADTSLLPQFSSSDGPCEDHLPAANHLFCQPNEQPRDSMCEEVAAAGLCSDGAPNPNLVKALCPVSCGVAPIDCAFDSDSAAVELAGIWNLNGVSTCHDLVLQVPYERHVIPVICRFTAVPDRRLSGSFVDVFRGGGPCPGEDVAGAPARIAICFYALNIPAWLGARKANKRAQRVIQPR